MHHDSYDSRTYRALRRLVGWCVDHRVVVLLATLGVLAIGFAGMGDRNGRLSFEPRLPKGWEALRFPLTWRGSRLRVEITQHQLTVTAEEMGEERVHVRVGGELHKVCVEEPLVVALADQGLRIDGLLGDKPQVGGTRADGTKITAGVPEPMMFLEDVSPEMDAPLELVVSDGDGFGQG